MTDRQIAYAAVRYTDSNGHLLTGRRGEICDIPPAEIARLEARFPNSLVAPGTELAMPGNLLPLSEDADEEKIRNYLVSGNSAEILTQASEYPTSQVEKLLVAERTGLNRPALVQALEGRVGTLVTAPPLVDGPGSTVPDASKDEDVTPGDTLEDELADFVATSTIDAVLEKAGDDAALAEELANAEENRGTKARKTLIEQLNKIVEAGSVAQGTQPE